MVIVPKLGSVDMSPSILAYAIKIAINIIMNVIGLKESIIAEGK